jgi:hypothetical protein
VRCLRVSGTGGITPRLTSVKPNRASARIWRATPGLVGSLQRLLRASVHLSVPKGFGAAPGSAEFPVLGRMAPVGRLLMFHVKKILYPTDSPSFSNQAYFHAVALAEQHGASLTVLYVYVPGLTEMGVPAGRRRPAALLARAARTDSTGRSHHHGPPRPARGRPARDRPLRRRQWHRPDRHGNARPHRAGAVADGERGGRVRANRPARPSWSSPRGVHASDPADGALAVSPPDGSFRDLACRLFRTNGARSRNAMPVEDPRGILLPHSFGCGYGRVQLAPRTARCDRDRLQLSGD